MRPILVACETGEECLPAGFPLDPQLGAQALDTRLVVVAEVRSLGVDVLDQDVEIVDPPGSLPRTRSPSFSARSTRPRSGGASRGGTPGPAAPPRDAVEVLGIGADPDAGFVREEGAPLLTEHRMQARQTGVEQEGGRRGDRLIADHAREEPDDVVGEPFRVVRRCRRLELAAGES